MCWKRTIRFLILSLSLTLGLESSCFGWASKTRVFFGDFTTHKRLTKSAIAQISKTEYADVHFFQDILIEQANNEDAHKVGNANLWAPPAKSWTDLRNARYKANGFQEAYKYLGWQIHLVEDAQVPAHIKQCNHGNRGLLVDPDEMEWYTMTHHTEVPHGLSDTEWFGNDAEGHRWSYWLSDGEDDDSQNEKLGDDTWTWIDPNDHSKGTKPYNDATTPDGPAEWGIHSTWGTYGKGHYPENIIPGNNHGGKDSEPFKPFTGIHDDDGDWFEERPRKDIVEDQLFKARETTIKFLQEASDAFPPLVRFFNVAGKKVTKGKKTFVCVGPNKKSEITFQVYENRSQEVGVHLWLQETGAAIHNSEGSHTGKWDEKNKVQLGQGDQLPWQGHFLLKWGGEAGGSKAKEGRYHLAMSVTDENGNKNPESTESFDNNKPIPVIIDAKAPRIDISGAVDGGRYTKAVLVAYRIKDSYLDPATVKAKNIPKSETIVFFKGTDKEFTVVTGSKKFYSAGTYKIEVTGEDLAGNPNKKTIEFKIEAQRDINPDDNEDSSTPPVLIGSDEDADKDGPDEDAPELPTPHPTPPPQGGREYSQIGVLESGFYKEMMQLLGSINVPFDLVDPFYFPPL